MWLSLRMVVSQGATRGIAIGHVSPEAAEGGNIALIEDGDEIVIDLPNRTLDLLVDDATLSRTS